MSDLNDCEEQGYGLISDGSILCARWEGGKLVKA